jgi:hypothetical protein
MGEAGDINQKTHNMEVKNVLIIDGLLTISLECETTSHFANQTTWRWSLEGALVLSVVI